MPRLMPIDPLPPEGGGYVPQLLYTLRPTADFPELADQSDATFDDSSLSLPTTRRISVEAPLENTAPDPTALINYVVPRVRGCVLSPPAQTRYTNATVSLNLETGELLDFPVAMWPLNSIEERVGPQVATDPLGDEWTLEKLLACFVGGAVVAQGGVTPVPTLRIADIALDVYGVPSSELATRKFEAGVYDLGLNDVRYIAHLTDAEIKGVYESARASQVPLSLKALSLDSGALIDRESSVQNSSYSGMLDAIAAASGGSLNPEEL